MVGRIRRLWGWARAALAWDVLKWAVGGVIGAATAIWGLLKDWGPLAIVLGLAAVALVLVIWTAWTARRLMMEGVRVASSAQPIARRPEATAEDFAGSFIRGKIVRIANMVPPAPEEGVIRGKTFEDCIIEGPGILGGEGNQFLDLTLIVDPGTEDAVLIEYEPPAVLYGAVPIMFCVFRGCTFHRIGLLASPDEAVQFRKQIRKAGERVRLRPATRKGKRKGQ